MRGLKTLVCMQLKDKLNLSFLHSVKGIIFKVLSSVIKFSIISIFIYFVFYILSYMRLVSILPGIPSDVLSVVFSIMIILSILFCTIGLVKSLYYSKDNSLLLTMPVERVQVFISKIIVYFIYELFRNVYYFLPLFISYGLINNLQIFYYIWVVLMIPIISGVIVSIGVIFSVPMMYLSITLKNIKFLKYFLIILLIFIGVLGVVLLINAIPQNIDLVGTWGTTFWQIQSFVGKFVRIFIPFAFLLESVIGRRYGVSNSFLYGRQFLILFVVILCVVMLFLIGFYIVKPIYFRFASSPYEYKKHTRKTTLKNHKVSPFFSMIKKDVILYFRDSGKLYSLLIIVVGLPIAILLLNKLYGAMDTRLTGAYMTIAFNILIILLFALSTNTSISYTYSSEGASGYLLRTIPIGYVKSLFSKLILNILLVSISIVVSVIIFSSFAGLKLFDTVCVCILIEGLYISHLFLSAELDIMTPMNSLFQTTGVVDNNPNVIKSSIWLFVLSGVFAFLTYFFITENAGLVFIRLIIFMLIFLDLRVWLFINKARHYFKERM